MSDSAALYQQPAPEKEVANARLSNGLRRAPAASRAFWSRRVPAAAVVARCPRTSRSCSARFRSPEPRPPRSAGWLPTATAPQRSIGSLHSGRARARRGRRASSCSLARERTTACSRTARSESSSCELFERADRARPNGVVPVDAPPKQLFPRRRRRPAPRCSVSCSQERRRAIGHRVDARRGLHALRDALRDASARSAVDRGSRAPRTSTASGGSTTRAFYVEGWLRPRRRLRSLRLTSSRPKGGGRARAGVFRHPRPDVAEFFGCRRAERLGFIAYFETPEPSPLRRRLDAPGGVVGRHAVESEMPARS